MYHLLNMLLHSTVPKASSYRYSIKQHRLSPASTEMTAKTDLDRNPGAPNGRATENPAEAKAEAPAKEAPHPRNRNQSSPQAWVLSMCGPHWGPAQHRPAPSCACPGVGGVPHAEGSLVYSLNSISRPEPSAALSFLCRPVVFFLFCFFHLILAASLSVSHVIIQYHACSIIPMLYMRKFKYGEGNFSRSHCCDFWDSVWI